MRGGYCRTRRSLGVYDLVDRFKTLLSLDAAFDIDLAVVAVAIDHYILAALPDVTALNGGINLV
jgi:hypothetical protein